MGQNLNEYPKSNDDINKTDKNCKFFCYIDIEKQSTQGQEKETKRGNPETEADENRDEFQLDELNLNEEYRHRLVENNFDLMNGQTIQVTTNRDQIPHNFLPLDDLDQLKQAIA